MYIQLIRNQVKGDIITGRLVINGRWFCYTIEHIEHKILALCYPVRVTMSPEFNRLLPLVAGIAKTRMHGGSQHEEATGGILLPPDKEMELTQLIRHTQVHEEVILEVIDFRPGTDYGYNTPCPAELVLGNG